MSAYLLGVGFQADMGTPQRKLVLLKLIDACEDDGTRIFPAVATVARAAQCSTRQVQRELKEMIRVGLLRLVCAGGRGRRSTNEYAMDLDMLKQIADAGWTAFIAGRPSVQAADDDYPKGDTVSPYDPDAKGDTGDTGDTFRVTQATLKGDSRSHPTPKDPLRDPSDARAREDGADAPERGEADVDRQKKDPKAVQRQFKRVVNGWPGFEGRSLTKGEAEWNKLTQAERDEAEAERDRWIKVQRNNGWRQVPAPSSYFAEKLWMRLPPAGEAEKPKAVSVPVFGPLWAAHRFSLLLAGPTQTASALTKTQQVLVETGKADADELRLQKQASSGFPAVNAMDDQAKRGRGRLLDPRWEALASAMEAVPVNSDAWRWWRDDFARRGWPWLPDPGRAAVVYFPVNLDAFCQALDEMEHEAGQPEQQAARKAG